jgi:hypothetical protein
MSLNLGTSPWARGPATEVSSVNAVQNKAARAKPKVGPEDELEDMVMVEKPIQDACPPRRRTPPGWAEFRVGLLTNASIY